jgi:hypothetical protein
MSPGDSPVVVQPHLAHHLGQHAYIGLPSLHRQLLYMETLLTYPQEFFLLHDADSIMLSAEVPAFLYENSVNTLWSNEIIESGASQPLPETWTSAPYFLHRESLKRMVIFGSRIRAPYYAVCRLVHERNGV